jgi:hypothetical protein
MSASSVIGAEVRDLARALAELFEFDRGLASELNVAQRRLLDANDRRRIMPSRGVVSEDVRQAFVEYSTTAERRREVACQVGRQRRVWLTRCARLATARRRHATPTCGRCAWASTGRAEQCSHNRW